MTNAWVLRLPQVDKPLQPILVHVTQKKSANLDLDLLATDGEVAYRGKGVQRNLSKLKSSNFDGDDDEWTALLRYALLSKQNFDHLSRPNNSIEVDCVVIGEESNATLSVTLRSRIEDITHRLGAIELPFSDNTDDVDLFGWACQLADQRDKLEERATSTGREAQTTRDTISGLEKQLNDLIKAKAEHEEQLLSKFAALLNEKKLKIRNQQRILQTAKVNKNALDEMQHTIAGETASSSSKRKRDNGKVQEANEQGDDESDGFEAMDIDKISPADAQENYTTGQETPPRSQTSETETASEDEGIVEPAEAPATKLPGIRKSNTASSPPPPRSLPFQRKGQKADSPPRKEPPPTSTVDDEETESEDDEL